MNQLIPVLIYPWKATVVITGVLWFIYWDNLRSDVDLREMLEISGSVHGILVAGISCLNVFQLSSCYSEIDEMGFIAIGATWSVANLVRGLKKILPSQPH